MTGNDLKGFRFRESTRAPFETDVKLRFDRFGGSVSGYCADLSVEGMFVKTKDPKPVGTLVQFEFKLPEGEVIQGLGDVVWIRPRTLAPNKPPGMGVQFRYLDPHSRELIFKIVDGFLQDCRIPNEPEESSVERPLPSLEEKEEKTAPPPVAPAASLTDLPPPAPSSLQPPPGPASVVEELSTISLEPEFSLTAPSLTGGSRRRSGRGRILALAGVLMVAVAVVTGFYFWDDFQDRMGLGPSREASPSGPPSEAALPGGGGDLDAAAGSEAETSSTIEEIETPLDEDAPSLPARDGEAADISEPAAVAEEPEPEGSDSSPPPQMQVSPLPAGLFGTRLSSVEEILFEQRAGETVIIVVADGDFTEDNYQHSRLRGESPREVIRISGITQAPRMTVVPMGTESVRQVRVGYHPSPIDNQVHVVLDLTSGSARVSRIEPRGSRLLIHVTTQ